MSNPEPQENPEYAALYPNGIEFSGLKGEQTAAINSSKEYKSYSQAVTGLPIGEPSSDAAAVTPDFFGHPATQAPAPLANLGFHAGLNPASPQTPNLWNPAPVRVAVTALDFVAHATPILDSGVGTPEQIQQVVDSSVPSPNTFMRELFPDSVPDDSNVPTSSSFPTVPDIKPVASPRTWAQIARGDPIKAPSPAAKAASPASKPSCVAAKAPSPASKASSAVAKPLSPVVRAAPGRTPPPWHSGTGRGSATPGARGGSRKLGSPFKATNVRRSGLILPQQQTAVPTPGQPSETGSVPVQINSVPGGNQRPRPQQPSQLGQLVDSNFQVGTPDVTILGAKTKPTQPVQPSLLPTGRPVGVGGFPGFLDPIEGTSFTPRHADPRIQSFGPKGGLERLNTTMAAVAIQKNTRGRSSSPPGVDLSAPSTGTLNIRTGLDSLNEFNQNYGHHVKGAIRQARSISGASTRAASSSTVPNRLDRNTASAAISTETGIPQPSPALGGPAAPRLVLDTELYGTTTTHQNGQKLWQCKSCLECPPLMADNNAGRGLIAKHIKGHLKGDRDDPIRRQIVPQEAAEQAVPLQHQSGLSSSQQSYDGLGSDRAFLVEAIQASSFPEAGTQFGWPATREPAVGSGPGHPGPQPSQSRSEYNQFRGSRSPAQGFAEQFSQVRSHGNPRSTGISHQGYQQGTQSTHQQTQFHNSTAHENRQFGHAALHVPHFSQHGSHANPTNLDAPGQQMQISQAPLSHPVSEFTRSGYDTVPNAAFTDFAGTATPAPPGLGNSRNEGWGPYMNYQSPPPPRQQGPQLLLNTAALGVSDRGTPPPPNMGAGVVGHFHSGGYGAAVSPGPFPYTGYIGPGAFGSPQPQTPGTPADYVGNLYANPPRQPAEVGFAGGRHSPMPQPEDIELFAAAAGFAQPVAPTGGGFAPAMVLTATDFGQDLPPGEFQPGTPLLPVLSSLEEHELIDELLQENHGSGAGDLS